MFKFGAAQGAGAGARLGEFEGAVVGVVCAQGEREVTPMQKHWDLIFGVAGTGATLTLTQFNQLLACGAGVLTIFILVLRLMREWRNRNNKPE